MNMNYSFICHGNNKWERITKCQLINVLFFMKYCKFNIQGIMFTQLTQLLLYSGIFFLCFTNKVIVNFFSLSACCKIQPYLLGLVIFINNYLIIINAFNTLTPPQTYVGHLPFHTVDWWQIWGRATTHCMMEPRKRTTRFQKSCDTVQIVNKKGMQ